MAYCYKCGVELEAHRDHCVLCHYPIPADLVASNAEPIYPQAENAHEGESQALRNKIFYTYFVFGLASITIALVLNFVYALSEGVKEMLQYGIITIVASIVIVFCLLGYIKRITRVFLGLGITTIFYCLALDGLDANLSWSVTYAIPIALMAMLIFIFTAKKYEKSAHTNHFIFVPIYMCLAFAVLLPFVEIVISLNLLGQIKMRWSLIATISLLAFSGFLSGLYFKLPDYIKERLIRLFHI